MRNYVTFTRKQSDIMLCLAGPSKHAGLLAARSEQSRISHLLITNSVLRHPGSLLSNLVGANLRSYEWISLSTFSLPRAQNSELRGGRLTNQAPSCLSVAQQDVERGEVCDHQHGHVDDRDRVRGTQLARQRRKGALGGVVIVENEVDHSHEIKGDYEQPKERPYSYCQKRHNGEHPSCQVPIGGERGETGGQIGADDARKDKDQTEEAEAVQGGYGALCFDQAHRLESRPEVGAKAKHPSDVT